MSALQGIPKYVFITWMGHKSLGKQGIACVSSPRMPCNLPSCNLNEADDPTKAYSVTEGQWQPCGPCIYVAFKSYENIWFIDYDM